MYYIFSSLLGQDGRGRRGGGHGRVAHHYIATSMKGINNKIDFGDMATISTPHLTILAHHYIATSMKGINNKIDTIDFGDMATISTPH